MEIAVPSRTQLQLEEVYAGVYPRLVSLGRMISQNDAVAEDLAQETFTRVLRSVRADGAPLRDPVWPLLRTTLVRLAADRRRSAGREIRRLLLVATRDRPAFEEGDGRGFAVALGHLPPRMRACVALYYGEDMSTLDVAAALRCSPRTVENNLRSARTKLRRMLLAAPVEEGARPTLEDIATTEEPS